ncbi:homoserine dehydrogenase [Cuneatibacter sp. NSJ-177]|uniref:homoserine dehydrogenase n=1 Tax=Cuneatibacter sp. NSJ-177 TaxID=2931401 RepID=UPI001FD3AB97|nr:homoserine dehydrogenase [Cuneatibacter sp. NSJ-177]MCJ7835331.1 homoserine dehydrogenase [Cuneatibacter sp. NSJ-177]
MRQIAIMGFGTIGSGVFDVVNTNREVIKRNLGEELQVKYVLDIREFPGQPVEKVLVHDVDTIVNDPDVDIVVETMGGLEPAFTFVKKALEAGKSVATSNKELVAKKGVELLALAKEKNSNFFFGASVGGGIPIIRPLLRSLSADEIDQVTGILNGTTNYILTKMDQEETSFEDALKEAQDNGFAERKPEADVEGFDACRKIAILSSIVLEKFVNFEDIQTEGITKITTADFQYARKLGWAIKLLGSSWKENGRVYAMVAPALVKPENPLFAVNDVFNAILVHGNMVDNVMFYGRGAGSHATASAVMADVVEAAKNLHQNIYAGWTAEKQELSGISTSRKQFLIRVKGDASRKSELVEKFGSGQLIDAGVAGEIGYLTPVISEKEFDEAAAGMEGILHRIRVQA